MNKTQAQSTRREFLRTSTAVTLGGIAAAHLNLAPQGFAANTDTLKVGLVGCGGRGSGAARDALAADPNTVLTAIADVFAEPCRGAVNALRNDAKFRDRVKVTPETTFVGLDGYQKLIASGVDVVLLASPPGFRPAHLQAAVAAGKHVFCEKPMATDAPGVRTVLAAAAAAKEKKLSLVAGFCWRADTACREFYKRVHDGAIGDVRFVHATYLTGPVKPMPPASARPAGMTDIEWQLRHWYNFVWLSGDGLVEQACHSVDKIAWAMNGLLPVKAVATGGRVVPNNEGNIFDHIDVFYEYPGGVRATMAQRQIPNCYSDNSDYLLGSKGTGQCGWNPPVIRGETNWRQQGPRPGAEMYVQEHRELFASIRSGEARNDGVWMAHSTLMALMGRTAAYTGQEIAWEQMLESKEQLVPENPTWDMKLPIPPMAVPGKTKFA
ncbi:MAG TPA: Gfo/Idh/MocA family oxidoreductase [Verrucomicrobiota bacterium]|nr:Gfo/Idh/MocA family oxidoreductase [Verrucomicrobiota bacterium]HNU50914.1 Gfo/Idh/MocA family oxidoreductase [Verrucomicrobiota bacterium]